jgi:mono/diheme cytochrome c family protein
LLERGRARFDVYCAVCHGAAGLGNGPVKQAGFAEVAKLTDPRIRSMPDGQIFQTITSGKGLMASYAAQISPHDRWAVVAYVRAIQKSQNARLDDVPEPHRTELKSRD